VLLCGAGSVPVEDFTPQGPMQSDLNAGGHNLTNIATISATNLTISGTLTAPGIQAPIALTTSDHEGEMYDLAGPEPMTGERSAQIWSRALGQPIAYAGNDLDAWQHGALTYMPDWLVFDARYMYAYFQECGFKASPEAMTRLTNMLGHPPRSFETFATETAAAWLAR